MALFNSMLTWSNLAYVLSGSFQCPDAPQEESEVYIQWEPLTVSDTEDSPLASSSGMCYLGVPGVR